MEHKIGTVDELHKISPKFNEEILTSILQEVSRQSDAKLVRYTVGRASAKGDSYLSTVSRLKVEGSSVNSKKAYSVGLIVKSLPSNIAHRETFRSVEFFRNEVAFYTKVLPKMLAFQKKKCPKSPFIEIPRCFHAIADGENDFVLMEDLQVPGFVPASRQESIDFEHCAKALRSLGRFHGLSLAMKDQEPEEFKEAATALKETYYSEAHRSWYKGALKMFCDIALDAVSKEFPDTKYEEKAKDFFSGDLYSLQIEYVKPKEPYSVITNGDAWICNFLYRYAGSDEKIIEDTRIIDFQLSRYSSPVCDISFFLYSCTTKQFRDAHYSDLLQVYYKSLSDMITDLGSDPDSVFSYKAFKGEVKNMFGFGFIMSLESVPLSMLEEHETANIDSIQGTGAVPLESVWIIPPLDGKRRLRIAENVVFAIDEGHI